MKASPYSSVLPFAGWLAAALMLTATSSLRAVSAITAVTTTITTGTPTVTNGVTFDNNDMVLTGFTNGSGVKYYTNNGLSNVTNEYSYIRRDTTDGDPNNSSMWYANSSATTMLANSSTSMSDSGSPGQTTLLANNFYAGADNLFANSGATAPTIGNVERADFLFGTTGVTTSNQLAFVVFDRGTAGQHDPFSIAAITGFNSVTGAVTLGGTLLSVTTAQYGAVNPTDNGSAATTFNYSLFRYSNGDTLGSPSYWATDTETGNQGIGGVMITTADMGLADGTTIYGYALMGSDVTDNGNIANLANWNNTTFYPTNTSSATPGAGGLDPAAINGVLFKIVPEPSAYGAIFTGLAMTVALLRKKRAKVTSRAA